MLSSHTSSSCTSAAVVNRSLRENQLFLLRRLASGRTNSIDNADLHALNLEALDILRRRHTNNSTYKYRALQYRQLDVKVQGKFSPNSPKTNSAYNVDVRAG